MNYIDLTYILNKLARRANKNDLKLFESEYMWLDVKNYNLNYYICLICHEKVYVGVTEEHGIQHLKEHNLLAFL